MAGGRPARLTGRPSASRRAYSACTSCSCAPAARLRLRPSPRAMRPGWSRRGARRGATLCSLGRRWTWRSCIAWSCDAGATTRPPRTRLGAMCAGLCRHARAARSPLPWPAPRPCLMCPARAVHRPQRRRQHAAPGLPQAPAGVRRGLHGPRRAGRGATFAARTGSAARRGAGAL